MWPSGVNVAAQLFPFALVAIDAPGLDQFRAGDLVGECYVSAKSALLAAAINDRTIRMAVPACHGFDRA